MSLAVLLACASPDGVVRHGAPERGAAESVEADSPVAADTDTSPCPEDMAPIGAICMDRYEAPNREGALPLVMYTYDEAGAWCAARDRRLCTDAEWEAACSTAGADWPYGDTHNPGTCNDEEIWRLYSQDRLDGWPSAASSPDIDDLDALYAAVDALGAADAADHVAELYQGEAGGANPGCTADGLTFDLSGNVEEWTTRADGGEASFHGNLKGRYWAEARARGSNVTTHGDSFRFYELGFRCCWDPSL